MTPSPNAPSTFDDGAYVGWLLGAIKDPGQRAVLRRADLPAAEHMAYPLLAPRWAARPALQRPMLLHAAAAARYDRVRQSDGHRAGLLARDLWIRELIQKSSVETRLLAVQRRSLPESNKILGGLLAAANSTGGFTVDWFDLWRAYRYWNAEPDVFPQRKRLLQDFYTTATAHTQTKDETP